MEREFYEFDNWLNPNILFAFNKQIIEYDMGSAGLSITRELKLISDDLIEKLVKMPKDKRVVEIGKIQRDNPAYRTELQKGFCMFRKMFVEANGLERDDVISIKRDAIFPMKFCRHTEFGQYIKFNRKNEYSSYARIGPRLELYYSSNGIDVKGIDDSRVKLHEDYMLEIIRGFFERMESLGIPQTQKYIKKKFDEYKHKKLPLGYYRRFDSQSAFETTDDVYGAVNMDTVVINYNIGAVFIKLAKITL